MPLLTDWIMIGITAVYVIATIAIWCTNQKSTVLLQKQIDETNKQFLEENRPKIEVEICYLQRSFYALRFVNNGRLTAKKVRIEIQQDFIDSLLEPVFREKLQELKNKECIIGVNQHYDLLIGSNDLRNNSEIKPATGIVSYRGGEKDYTSDFSIDLGNYMTFFGVTSDYDRLIKAIKDNTKELKSIRNAIVELNEKNS